MEARCACGRPLHYANNHHRDWVERVIADLGPTIAVTVAGRTFLVPRHYIALHGIKASELPTLGFPEVPR